MVISYEERRWREQLELEELRSYQLSRLNSLLERVLPENRFYAQKYQSIRLPLRSWEAFRELPFTTKEELITSEVAGFAAHHTFPLDRYVRLHRTSGTQGRPLTILDTAEDWQWWIDGWQFVLDAAGITSADRVLLAFSFGPFIGFWSAYDACAARGALVIPTGGMTTLARVDMIQTLRPTCVLCTPSYALHLAEVARQNNIDLSGAGVRKLIVAGEPGGSIPSVRQRIEAAWGAVVIDHSGATEVGPWGYADCQRCGLHVNESEFIAEFRPIPESTAVFDAEGQLAELVITTLGRVGCPVIRYRTGDLVRPIRKHHLSNRFVLLDGGVLGRVDDMVTVRGVNVFPSALDCLLREFPEIDEYRITVYRERELDELRIEVEDRAHQPQRIAEFIQRRLGLRVHVVEVPGGSLPRFEGKARRFVDQRKLVSDPHR